MGTTEWETERGRKRRKMIEGRRGRAKRRLNDIERDNSLSRASFLLLSLSRQYSGHKSVFKLTARRYKRVTREEKQSAKMTTADE